MAEFEDQVIEQEDLEALRAGAVVMKRSAQPAQVEGGIASAAAQDLGVMIEIARRYPRDLEQCKINAKQMVMMSQGVAESCIYAIPRAGKTIQGPSVRLAEILVNAWGNIRVATRITEETATHVTAEAAFLDLEANVAFTTPSRKRITKSNGQRYSEDMVQQTAQAAVSIAYRNAILKGIPAAITDDVYQTAMQFAASGGDDPAKLPERRQQCIDKFSAIGVEDAEVKIPALMNRADVDSLRASDLVILRRFYNTIKAGEASIAEVFAPLERRQSNKPETPEEQRSVREAVRQKREAEAAPEEGEQPEEVVQEAEPEPEPKPKSETAEMSSDDFADSLIENPED